jgi:hypothetical protein
MYSKKEAKLIKQEFWTTFAKEFPKKWILFNTKIKDFSLKFEIENKIARVGIDISTQDPNLKLIYFQKIESLRSILEEEFVKNCIFDYDFELETGKKIAKIYVTLEEININNKNCWEKIFTFFDYNMNEFENFFLEHEDYIKDLSWNT